MHLHSVILFVAFLLLFLVALSLPIIKSIYIFSVQANTKNAPATSIATQLRFGVWGFCATSALDPATTFSNPGECTTPQLGYQVSQDILNLTGQPQIIDAVLESLVIILVLHPLCAALTFAVLLTGTISFWFGIQWLAIVTLVLTIVTGFIATASAAIDFSLVGVAHEEVPNLTADSFSVSWGPAPWMTIGGTLLLWTGVVLLSVVCCRCCGLGRRHGSCPNQFAEVKP